MALPEDIVFDILAKLPVKSLKRFRSVTKPWCSLIENTRFISAHHAFHKNRACPLVKHDHLDEKKCMISLLSDQTLEVVADLEIPLFADKTENLLIQGYCDGIVCFWEDSVDVTYLWNPATKEHKILPTCPFDNPPPPGYDIEINAVAFGFDSKRDDYTVLRFYAFWDADLPGRQGKHLAMYNLGTDSWRKFHGNLPAQVECQYFQNYQVFSNGFYHCLAFQVGGEDLLLSFDLSDEVFITTPLPIYEPVGKFVNSNLHEFVTPFPYFMEINGSVGALFSPNPFLKDRCYDVWVLGEVGVSKSWTKLFTVGPIYDARFPLGINSNNGFFFEIGDEVLVGRCSDKETKIAQVKADIIQLVSYAESLVSLKTD